MVRMYFNRRHADNGLIWSVDSGDISTEVNVAKVVIKTNMETGYNPAAQFPEPSGWLYTENAILVIDKKAQTATILKLTKK